MSRTGSWTLMGAAAFLFGLAPAHAQSNDHSMPPQNGMKLSQIVAKVEQRDHFQYVSEIDWSDNGYYDVTYYTNDKAKVEIKVDPVSGLPR